MSVVFIHGVADTGHVWDEVRGHLSNVHTEALALPGFGTAIPDGFTADKENYVEWIINQLEKAILQ